MSAIQRILIGGNGHSHEVGKLRRCDDVTDGGEGHSQPQFTHWKPLDLNCCASYQLPRLIINRMVD